MDLVTLKQLKDHMKERGVSLEGNKKQLFKRLRLWAEQNRSTIESEIHEIVLGRRLSLAEDKVVNIFSKDEGRTEQVVVETAERLEESATAGIIDSERKMIINLGVCQRTEPSTNNVTVESASKGMNDDVSLGSSAEDVDRRLVDSGSSKGSSASMRSTKSLLKK